MPAATAGHLHLRADMGYVGGTVGRGLRIEATTMMRWGLVTLVVAVLVFAVLLGRQTEAPGWLAPALAAAFLAGVAVGWLRRRTG